MYTTTPLQTSRSVSPPNSNRPTNAGQAPSIETTHPVEHAPETRTEVWKSELLNIVREIREAGPTLATSWAKARDIMRPKQPLMHVRRVPIYSPQDLAFVTLNDLLSKSNERPMTPLGDTDTDLLRPLLDELVSLKMGTPTDLVSTYIDVIIWVALSQAFSIDKVALPDDLPDDINTVMLTLIPIFNLLDIYHLNSGRCPILYQIADQPIVFEDQLEKGIGIVQFELKKLNTNLNPGNAISVSQAWVNDLYLCFMGYLARTLFHLSMSSAEDFIIGFNDAAEFLIANSIPIHLLRIDFATLPTPYSVYEQPDWDREMPWLNRRWNKIQRLSADRNNAPYNRFTSTPPDTRLGMPMHHIDANHAAPEQSIPTKMALADFSTRLEAKGSQLHCIDQSLTAPDVFLTSFSFRLDEDQPGYFRFNISNLDLILDTLAEMRLAAPKQADIVKEQLLSAILETLFGQSTPLGTYNRLSVDIPNRLHVLLSSLPPEFHHLHRRSMSLTPLLKFGVTFSSGTFFLFGPEIGSGADKMVRRLGVMAPMSPTPKETPASHIRYEIDWTRFVAAKTRKFDGFVDPYHTSRIAKEMKMLKAYNHPGIIRPVDVVMRRNHLGQVTPVHILPAGHPLSHRTYEISTDVDVSSRLKRLFHTLNALLPVLDGLSYLHTTKFVAHRDVKPCNILVCASGKGLLIDVGHSAPIMDATYSGTRDNMPPELLDKTKRFIFQGDRGDVYGFGMVLLETILLGINPLSYHFTMGTDAHCKRHMPQLVTDLEMALQTKYPNIDLGDSTAYQLGLIRLPRQDNPLYQHVLQRSHLKDPKMKDLLALAEDCLQEAPNKRPSIAAIKTRLKAAIPDTI